MEGSFTGVERGVEVGWRGGMSRGDAATTVGYGNNPMVVDERSETNSSRLIVPVT